MKSETIKKRLMNAIDDLIDTCKEEGEKGSIKELYKSIKNTLRSEISTSSEEIISEDNEFNFNDKRIYMLLERAAASLGKLNMLSKN